MIDLKPIILDSNIFFGYANSLETQHTNCKELFKKPFNFLTCKRVQHEISKVIRRRERLYKELTRLISRGSNLTDFFRGKDLHENDKRDLHNIIKWLESLTGDKLYYFRRFIRFIKIGIEDAFSKICSPLIEYSMDYMLFASVNSCVVNHHDAWIIVDSFCWCEKEDAAILCSTDETDIIRNRDKVTVICMRCRPFLQCSPLNILRVTEVLALSSK